MTERSSSDDQLKARFLTAAFDGSERSFDELKRDLGWSKETFDRVRRLLLNERKISGLSPEVEQREENRQAESQLSAGLLTIRPHWLGTLLITTSVIAVPVGALGFACMGAFVAGTAIDALTEGLQGKKGWADAFHWSDPLLRVSVIGLIVGLLGVIYSAALQYVSARRQGANLGGFFSLLCYVVRLVPGTLWGIFLLMLKLLAPGTPTVGSPPGKYIPVQPDDPRLHRRNEVP